MPKGNWMYGDNLDKDGKDKPMSVINPADGGRIDYPIDCGPTDRERVQDYPKNEFTRENTIGDPWGAIEPTKLGKKTKSWSVLKSVFKWYFIACGIVVNIVQLIMWV